MYDHLIRKIKPFLVELRTTSNTTSAQKEQLSCYLDRQIVTWIGMGISNKVLDTFEVLKANNPNPMPGSQEAFEGIQDYLINKLISLDEAHMQETVPLAQFEPKVALPQLARNFRQQAAPGLTAPHRNPDGSVETLAHLRAKAGLQVVKEESVVVPNHPHHLTVYEGRMDYRTRDELAIDGVPNSETILTRADLLRCAALGDPIAHSANPWAAPNPAKAIIVLNKGLHQEQPYTHTEYEAHIAKQLDSKEPLTGEHLAHYMRAGAVLARQQAKLADTIVPQLVATHYTEASRLQAQALQSPLHEKAYQIALEVPYAQQQLQKAVKEEVSVHSGITQQLQEAAKMDAKILEAAIAKEGIPNAQNLAYGLLWPGALGNMPLEDAMILINNITGRHERVILGPQRPILAYLGVLAQRMHAIAKLRGVDSRDVPEALSPQLDAKAVDHYYLDRELQAFEAAYQPVLRTIFKRLWDHFEAIGLVGNKKGAAVAAVPSTPADTPPPVPPRAKAKPHLYWNLDEIGLVAAPPVPPKKAQ